MRQIKITLSGSVMVWLAALLVVLANSNGHLVRATTIVVARSASEIVIGADSKVTDTYGSDLKIRTCKILPAGNLVLAFEGFEVDRKTGFSVPETATKALQLRSTASVADKVSILTGVLFSKLTIELAALQKRDSESYARKFAWGQTFLRVLIAGFENDRPLVFIRNFRATQVGSGKIGITVFTDDCLDDCKGEIATRFLGEAEAIEGLAEETSDFWRAGLPDGVRRLIETEIEARSEYVGPPIDLLRIDRRGVQWIQKKPECPNIRGSEKRQTRPATKKRRAYSLPTPNASATRLM